MKKIIKALLLIFSFLAVFELSNATTVKAAEETKKNVPEKVRAYDKDVETRINVTLANYDDTITNLKVDKKDARIKVIYFSKTERKDDEVVSDLMNEQTIGLYVEKYGTYTVTFDIVDKEGKKISSEKIKVYCYESPFTVKVDGKVIKSYSALTAKSGKLQVTAAKGNTIKKLEYGVAKEIVTGSEEDGNYRSSIEYTYKKFKSGSKITFNSLPSSSEYSSVYGGSYSSNRYYNMYTSFYADTPLLITYKDKYTKEIETYKFEITRITE